MDSLYSSAYVTLIAMNTTQTNVKLMPDTVVQGLICLQCDLQQTKKEVAQKKREVDSVKGNLLKISTDLALREASDPNVHVIFIILELFMLRHVCSRSENSRELSIKV